MQYDASHAEQYARYRDEPSATDPVLFEALATIGLHGQRVLDVGCGDGRHLASFLSHGASSVTGVDVSPAMIERATVRFAGAALPVELHVADVRLLPFDNGAFDVVSSNYVLQHLPAVALAMQEIARVLRVGGWFAGIFNTVEVSNEALWNAEMPLLLGRDHTVRVHDLMKSDQEFLDAFTASGLTVLRYEEIKSTAVIDPAFPHIKEVSVLRSRLCVAEKQR